MKLAKHIDVDTTAGVVTIDGEQFGFYLVGRPVEVTVGSRDELGQVTLNVLAEHVTVTDEGVS